METEKLQIIEFAGTFYAVPSIPIGIRIDTVSWDDTAALDADGDELTYADVVSAVPELADGRWELILDRVARMNKILGARELDILHNRILSASPQTLELIGQRHGITRERVRQLEARLIGMMRGRKKKKIKVWFRQLERHRLRSGRRS